MHVGCRRSACWRPPCWPAARRTPTGCGKSARQFYGGNLETARSTINTNVALHGGEANVLKLERAIVDLSAGRPKDAEQTLREVRDAFDYLEQKSVAEGALAIATDDNAMSYAGEDYEKILVRAFLALSNLMADGGDAEAYSLQVADKQEQIIQPGADETGKNPKADYKRVALGAYLHGALREETHFDYDDAARSWAKVVSWEPGFAPGSEDVQRAEHGTHCRPGNGVLYVFTLVGRGPYKVEKAEVRSSIAMLIGDRIVSGTARHTLPPTLAPIKVPMVVVSPFHVARRRGGGQRPRRRSDARPSPTSAGWRSSSTRRSIRRY